MPAGQCSKCSYPLDDDEVGKRACPACGTPLRHVAPFQPLERPESRPAAPPPPRRSLLWPLGGMTLLALASFGAGMYLMRPADGKQTTPATNTLAASPAAASQEPAKSSPPPKTKEPEAPKSLPKVEEPRKETKPEAPKKEPPPAVKPSPLLPEVLVGDDRRLNRPDGEYRIGTLLRGSTLKLSGKVKTLRVGIVDGASTLDASALDAQEIFFSGRIAGGATVKLRAPGGRVEFKSKVDGESRLVVDAPGGTVAFIQPTQPSREGSKIDGDSTVVVTAKTADFRGAIDGTRTRVVVTLTKGGLLYFRDIAGSVRLQYRTADPRDPPPRILGGEVHDSARLEKID
jgi:hypothetical protein